MARYAWGAPADRDYYSRQWVGGAHLVGATATATNLGPAGTCSGSCLRERLPVPPMGASAAMENSAIDMVTGQVSDTEWRDQAVEGVQGRFSVSMTRASKKLRPCLAAVDR